MQKNRKSIDLHSDDDTVEHVYVTFDEKENELLEEDNEVIDKKKDDYKVKTA